MVNHQTTSSITSLPTTQIHLIHITQMMLYQINQHPNLVHTSDSSQNNNPNLIGYTPHIAHYTNATSKIPSTHPFHPYHLHAFMFTQMKPLFWPNKTISLSSSQINLHIHLIHSYQFWESYSISRLQPSYSSNTWILCFMSKPQYQTITQHLHHHHHPNMKSSLKSSKKLMS